MNPNLSDATPSPHVIEASIVALRPVLGIADPDDAPRRLRELSGATIELGELEAMLRRAGDESPEDLVRVLRAALVPADEAATGDAQAVQGALEASGRKQLVLTPDHWYLAAVVAVGCLLLLRNPRKSERKRITVEEGADGRKKVMIDEQVVYLNPFSPLVQLINIFFGGTRGGDSDAG